jgi:hypothetical protein
VAATAEACVTGSCKSVSFRFVIRLKGRDSNRSSRDLINSSKFWGNVVVSFMLVKGYTEGKEGGGAI